MDWTEFAVSGVSKNTSKNIMLGAGTLYKDLVYSAETSQWTGTILGATNGGNKLSIKPEVTNIDVDGVLVEAKGLMQKTGETAQIETNMVEVTKDFLQSTVIGQDGVSEDTRFDVIESKALIDDDDYIENFAFVGFKTDGSPIIVLFDYAICTEGLELDNKNKEAAVIPATFKCVADLVAGGNTNKLPYHIYVPKSEYYEDYDGWKSALSYAQTIIMLIMLVSAFLVSGIFSNEFSWKSDSIFFSTKYGRDRGTRAKIMAGFIVVSVIYFIVISLYSLVVLGCLGSQGGNVMIQTGFWHWKSFYNITYMQLYLLTVVAGYIGTVFCLFLSMLVSAKTHTAVVAVTIPFAILFLPLFVSNFDFLSGILGVFPDRLLQINEIINTFDLYHIGGKIVGSIPIMLVIYPILSILMVPLMYHVYHKTEIK